MTDLTAALGARPPAEFDALSVAERAHLATLLDSAREDRTRAMNTAITDSLRVLPAVLRGPVRKVMGV